MLVIGSLNLLKAERVPAFRNFVIQFDTARADRRQYTHEDLAPVARLMRPNPHALAPMGLEVAQLRQWPIDPGRRHLQGVAPFYRIIDIEHIAEDRAQPLEIGQRNTAFGPVNEETQERGPRPFAILDADQLKALPLDMRVEQVGNPFRHRMKL